MMSLDDDDDDDGYEWIEKEWEYGGVSRMNALGSTQPSNSKSAMSIKHSKSAEQIAIRDNISSNNAVSPDSMEECEGNSSMSIFGLWILHEKKKVIVRYLIYFFFFLI